jgi:Fe-S-cluster containining protein
MGLALITEDEKNLFDRKDIMPLFAIGVDEPTHIIAYQLTLAACPYNDNDNSCKIYSKRPLACQSFPLTVELGRKIAEIKCPQIGRHYQNGEPCPVVFLEEENATQKMSSYIWNCFVRFGNKHFKLWKFDLLTRKWHLAR